MTEEIRDAGIVRFEQWLQDMNAYVGHWNKLVAERADMDEAVKGKNEIILKLQSHVEELTKPIVTSPSYKKVESIQGEELEDTAHRPFINGKENEDCPYSWVGHPDAGGDYERGPIIDARDDIEILAAISGAERWEYNEHAFITVNDMYYILHTSGCSCPSPSETWHILAGPCQADEDAFIQAHSGNENDIEQLWLEYASTVNKYLPEYRPWL